MLPIFRYLIFVKFHTNILQYFQTDTKYLVYEPALLYTNQGAILILSILKNIFRTTANVEFSTANVEFSPSDHCLVNSSFILTCYTIITIILKLSEKIYMEYLFIRWGKLFTNNFPLKTIFIAKKSIAMAANKR